MRKVGRLAGKFVCVSQALESLTNRTRQHGKLGAALLLLQDNQRLVKVRIAALDLLSQDIYLRILTSQTKNGCPGYVRMVDVPGN